MANGDKINMKSIWKWVVGIIGIIVAGFVLGYTNWVSNGVVLAKQNDKRICSIEPKVEENIREIHGTKEGIIRVETEIRGVKDLIETKVDGLKDLILRLESKVDNK